MPVTVRSAAAVLNSCRRNPRALGESDWARLVAHKIARYLTRQGVAEGGGA